MVPAPLAALAALVPTTLADAFFQLPRVPLGEPIEAVIRWMRSELRPAFEALADFFTWLVGVLESALGWPEPLIFALVVAAIAWMVRSWQFAIFTFLAFVLIDSMQLWTPMIDTLALVLVATLTAGVISVPIGILASRRRRVSTVLRPILDLMQTLPVFVYLIPAVFLFRLGTMAGLVATIVFATPPGVRLTELGIRQVDPEMVEAADAFGASKRQKLLKVQIPLALPSIMQGINQVIMLALSMVVVAALIGAGGLGDDVLRSVTRVNISLGFEAGLAVVILAIVLDRLTSAVGERAQRAAAD